GGRRSWWWCVRGGEDGRRCAAIAVGGDGGGAVVVVAGDLGITVGGGSVSGPTGGLGEQSRVLGHQGSGGVGFPRAAGVSPLVPFRAGSGGICCGSSVGGEGA
ncbi:unnamed protein product, partial [Ectocarpus sp. 12 AP-2014]